MVLVLRAQRYRNRLPVSRVSSLYRAVGAPLAYKGSRPYVRRRGETSSAVQFFHSRARFSRALFSSGRPHLERSRSLQRHANNPATCCYSVASRSIDRLNNMPHADLDPIF